MDHAVEECEGAVLEYSLARNRPDWQGKTGKGASLGSPRFPVRAQSPETLGELLSAWLLGTVGRSAKIDQGRLTPKPSRPESNVDKPDHNPDSPKSLRRSPERKPDHKAEQETESR